MIMRLALFAALLAALLATSCTSDEADAEPKAAPKAEAEPDAAAQKEAFDQIAKLTANVKSFSADITMLPAAGEPAGLAPLKGTVTSMPPYRVKMTMAGRGRKVTMISDGKTTWMVEPATKTVERFDVIKFSRAAKELGQPAHEQRFNIAAPFVHMAPGTAKLVGSHKAGGAECWVLQGKPNASIQATKGATVRVLVSKKDGLARRIGYTNPAHNIATGTSYDNAKVNVKVDPSIFTYTPPEGMNVVDRTELRIMVLKMMVERWEREK